LRAAPSPTYFDATTAAGAFPSPPALLDSRFLFAAIVIRHDYDDGIVVELNQRIRGRII
jgi:hypothetical protein